MSMRRGLGALACSAFALVGLAAGCGTDVVTFQPGDAVGVGGNSVGGGGSGGNPSNSGGNGGAGVGGSGGNPTNSGGSAVGGSGGRAGCTSDRECFIDAICVEGFCDVDGECASEPSPAGTSCGDGATCDGAGNCLLDDGEACGDEGECASGFCVDGVCCESACDDLCASCNVSGLEGVCAPSEAGTDPDLECAPGSCDGALGCATGEHEASVSFGAFGSQYARDVVVDSLGNVIIVGEFFQSLTFGTVTLTSNGQRDAFIAKFDPNGNLVFANSYGDFGNQYAWEVEVDANNNILVGGYFSGSLDLGAGNLTSAGQFDIFVAKLDPGGSALWSQRYGDGSDDQLRTLSVDGAGNVAVGGFFAGGIDFGNGPVFSAGSYDAWYATLSPTGAVTTSQRFGDAEDQRIYGVSYDPSGDLLITGRFFGTIDLGGGVMTSAGDRDVFIAKRTAAGAHVWSQRYGDGDVQLAWDVAADANGGAVVVGYFEGSVDFGGGAVTSAGGQDIFVVKVDATGAHQWSAGYGGGGDQQPQDVTIDGAGNVIVGGYGEDTFDLGGGDLTSGGFEDAFIAKYSPAGVHLWSKHSQSPGVDAVYTVTTNASNSVLAVGVHSSDIDWGGGALPANGGFDMFIAAFAP